MATNTFIAAACMIDASSFEMIRKHVVASDNSSDSSIGSKVTSI